MKGKSDSKVVRGAVTILVALAIAAGYRAGARSRSDAQAAPMRQDQDLAARMKAAQVWLPAMGASAPGCKGELVVQSLSARPTKAVLVTWGESGACPPDAAGPMHVECTGLLFPGANWIMTGAQLAVGSRSGTLYSLIDGELPTAFEVCEAIFWLKGDAAEYRRFQQAFLAGGQWRNLALSRVAGGPLAVHWTERCGEGLATYGAPRWGEASVRSEPEQAELSFLPLVAPDWDITVQNMGLDCAEAEVWFGAAGGDARLCGKLSITPGEARSLRVSDCGDQAGAAWVRATQPVAVVARTDGAGAGARAAYTGRGPGGPELHLSMPGDPAATTRVGLLNPSLTAPATVRLHVDEIMGHRRLLREAVLPPRGSLQLDLSAADLGSGTQRAFSLHAESVADDQGGRPQLLGAVWRMRGGQVLGAQEMLVTQSGGGSAVLAVPRLLKSPRDGADGSSRLTIHNDVSRPGYTDFAIIIYDQNGLLDFICEKLYQQESQFIDLSSWGYVNSGFRGSAVVSAVFWEHDRDGAGGQLPANPVGLSANVQTGGPSMADPDLQATYPVANGFARPSPIRILCGGGGPFIETPTPTVNRPYRRWLPMLLRKR